MKQSVFINRKSNTAFFGLPFMFWMVLITALFGCTNDAEVSYNQNIPVWFPPMEIPAENQLTQARVELGRRLFYEPLLSLDSSVSCASCHQIALAFTDGLPKSVGVNGAVVMRNAPTLANVGYAPRLFHDGGVATLELQSQSPIFAVDEMNFSIAGFLERIAADDSYTQMFNRAYNREPDAYGISRAIAAFERTFLSGHSRFDNYYYKSDMNALSDSEVRGMEIFFSENASCSSCHQPPLFTTFEYENVGLYSNYPDSGRSRITHLPEDNGKFKVPTLRNIELTAPYMHDGSLATLEQVVDHFNAGGVGHANQSSDVKPLGLTAQQKVDLLAFLESLTDESFINDSELVY